MKDIKLNPLDQNQRKLLQFGVVVVLIVFLAGYFVWLNREKASPADGNQRVYLQNSKLYVFNDIYTVKPYPDRILMHYPYLLIVQADKPLTIIYNLETKKKEKEIKDVLLDYYQGNIVYNRKESYFNNQNLDKYCDSAFIKSSNEVLCITKQAKDSVDNMLISIDPNQSNLWKRIYQSKNLLTTISVVKNNLYLAEIDLKTRQNYLTINNKSTPIDNIVNLIYPMKGNIYLASFKSNLNNNEESYFLINTDGEVIRQEGKEIVFY